MLVLALDTSTSRGSLALLRDRRLLAEYTLESTASYLNRLLAGIDQLLADAGERLHDLKLIVVSRGPGNFTGLRLGLSVAKGLALGLACPVIAINTLDALAVNIPYSPWPVCPVLDAKKNAVYAAFYRCPGANAQPLSDYLLLEPAALAARIQEPTVITGPGLERYGQVFRELLGELAILPPAEYRHVRAGVLARLGLEELEAGRLPDLEALTPFYLRPADAELKKPLHPSAQPPGGAKP